MAIPPDDNRVETYFPGEYVGFTSDKSGSLTVNPGSYTEDVVLQVDGKLLISGIPEDLKTTIVNMQKRLDKLERFYTQVVVEAQEVVNAAEQTESKDDWKERVFQIARDLGI